MKKKHVGEALHNLKEIENRRNLLLKKTYVLYN